MRRFWWIAIVFELTLAVIAIGIGPLFDVDVSGLFWPLDRAPSTLSATLLFAAAATTPLLLGLAITLRSHASFLAELRQFVESEFIPLFAPMTAWELCVIGFAAGLGEEMLFRGVIQSALMNQFGDLPVIAIGLTGLIFGALHFVTPAYAALATVAGFYLGWIFFLSGQLVMPILVHGLYDSLALIHLVRRAQQKNGSALDGQNR